MSEYRHFDSRKPKGVYVTFKNVRGTAQALIGIVNGCGTRYAVSLPYHRAFRKNIEEQIAALKEDLPLIGRAAADLEDDDFEMVKVHDDDVDYDLENELALAGLEEDDAEHAALIEQIRDRAEAFEDGEWHYVGTRARATVWIESKDGLVRYVFESAGLWGTESDSDDDYFESIFEDECSNLKNDLVMLAGPITYEGESDQRMAA